MKTRAAIDVSDLPASVMDHRSPIWWGNVLLLFIETTMFGILIATYLYARTVDFHLWPPPQVNQRPVLYHPLPDLTVPTINLVILLVSVAPMLWVDRACLKRDLWAVRVGLIITVLFGAAAAVVRYFEFSSIHFKWDENAYASIVWTLMGIHLAHIITGTSENLLMTIWVWVKGMDDKHARDVRVTTVYWYWIAGIWVLLYLLIYCVPRWF